jgi:hypothetical protein
VLDQLILADRIRSSHSPLIEEAGSSSFQRIIADTVRQAFQLGILVYRLLAKERQAVVSLQPL